MVFVITRIANPLQSWRLVDNRISYAEPIEPDTMNRNWPSAGWERLAGIITGGMYGEPQRP